MRMVRRTVLLLAAACVLAGLMGQTTLRSRRGEGRDRAASSQTRPAAAHLSDALMPVDSANPRVTPVVLAWRKVRPAVVNISSESVVTAGMGLFGGDPFEEIFPSPLLRRVPVQSLGSGFIINPQGYVVTNAHVVRRAQKITVTLHDGTSAAAKIISSDPSHDLAVLKINPPEGATLPYLPLGRSDDLMVGETVIAIGNPLGYSNSVTTGVVSAVNRTLEFGSGVKYDGLIQTDAPINPGNSGGPLLNIAGELIGINTAIRADAQNIGFAIPTDAVALDLARLLDFERINRVVFGAKVLPRHGKDGDGVYVDAVAPDTPAADGLKAGDRIVELDGQPVRQMPDYTCAMLAAKPSQPVRMKVSREGREMEIDVTLQAKPRPDGKALAERLLGMSLRTITPEIARDNSLPVERGLVATDVEQGGPAGQLGIRRGDILFQVNQLYVADLDDLGVLLEEMAPGKVMRIGLLRGNVAAWVNIAARRTGPTDKVPSQPHRSRIDGKNAA